MANRIILGAVLTLAMTLSPALAQAVPTKSTKKKSSTSTQTKVSKKSKYSKSRGQASDEDTPIRADITSSSSGYDSIPRKSAGVSETPPLMKVTPQRDGRFLLEPLSPKKPGPGSSLSRPLSQLNTAPPPPPTPSFRDYNRFEPWNFSDLVLTQAKYYKDTPYSRGGSLATGYATDCSGFVQYIYKGFKIDLPRSSAEQAQVGKVAARTMDFSKLLPGDLLFFSRGGRHIGHAGIYLGEGKMIHASNRRVGVTVTDLRQPYYEGTFVVAKRVFEVQYPK